MIRSCAVGPLVLSVVVAAVACSPAGTAKGPNSPGSAQRSAPPEQAPSQTQLCDGIRERARQAGPLFVDPEPQQRRKVIVSDLHLGAGERADARLQGLEDFHFDAQWQRFLSAQAERGPTDLIVAGDFIDFWQILGALDRLPERQSEAQRGAEPLLGSDQAGALAALQLVVAAHGPALAAIGHFLDGGDHRVILIAGNHDAELTWPAVRRELSRAIGTSDPERVLFVDAMAYQHGGVHVEHGHRYDGANRWIAAAAPAAMDGEGRCRLQSTWGQIFVAKFFNDLERRYPFIDNLYPESAALLWAARDEPDRWGELAALAQFIDLLVSFESKQFNLSAFGGVLRGALGLPARDTDGVADGVGAELAARLLNRLSSPERALAGLRYLRDAPAVQKVAAALGQAARHLPDVKASLAELGELGLEDLDGLRSVLLGDPLRTAARQIVQDAPHIRTVVFGHIHRPGGSVEALGPGSDAATYVNSGAWTAVRRVAELQAANVDWSVLSAKDRELFPADFPAVEIRYAGSQPGAPHLQSGQW